MIGGNTRIICPALLKMSKVISSADLLAGDKRCLETIASASTVIFSSYRKDMKGFINLDSSVLVAKLVVKLISEPSRLIYLSSDNVFSGRRGSYRIDDPPDPVTEYGKVKACQEEIFHAGVILRFTVMGPSFSDRPLIIELIKSGAVITGYPNAYFSPVSSWAINEVLLSHLQGKLLPGIHHLATERVSKQTLFMALSKKMHLSCSLREDSTVISDHSLIPSNTFERVLDAEMNSALEQAPKTYFV